MEEAEGSPEETQNTRKKYTSIRLVLERTCKKKISDCQELQKGCFLPPESVKVLHDWLCEHKYNAYPTVADKRMLAKNTDLSYLQVTKWFLNVRRKLRWEIVHDPDNLSDESQVANAAQGQVANAAQGQAANAAPGQAANATQGQADNVAQKQHSNPSKEFKAQVNAKANMQDLPLAICQESEEKVPYLESTLNQNVISEAKIENEDKNLITEPWSSAELAWPEEKPDLSKFYMLVDVAVQKYAEMEEQKKQNADPQGPQQKFI